MKLGELKESVMKMCENHSNPPNSYDEENSSYNFTEDQDYSKKMVVAINSAFAEISAKIPLIKVVSVSPILREIALPPNVKQVKKCECEGRAISFIATDEKIKFARDYKEVEITYEKVPNMFFSNTPNATRLEFADDICSVAVYGVCADIMKLSGDYEIFEAKFQSRMARLVKPSKVTFVNLHNMRGVR